MCDSWGYDKLRNAIERQRPCVPTTGPSPWRATRAIRPRPTCSYLANQTTAAVS
jgi:hypothetical protein